MPETVDRKRWWWVLALGAALAVAAGVAWPFAPPATEPTPTADEPSAGPAPFRPADIPKIDVHVHAPASIARAVVDLLSRYGVVVALNASGGMPFTGTLDESRRARDATGGRLLFYCMLDLRRVETEDFAAYASAALDRCHERGAIGLKVSKALGLGYVLSDGSLLGIDDPRLDVVFDRAGELGLPVLIHSGDPVAFFEPATEANERYAELSAHPSWSFYGARPDGVGRWPTWEDVFSQYERRVARHPRTRFVGAHFGNAPEDPDRVAAMLDRYPQLFVETGARIPEIGRHDAARMRALFDRHQDRILFGTDFQMGPYGFVLGSSGAEPDPPERIPRFFRSHFRYFETPDRGFAHPTPIQGDWTIDGLALSRPVLEKLYWRNAARIFGIELPARDDEPR